MNRPEISLSLQRERLGPLSLFQHSVNCLRLAAFSGSSKGPHDRSSSLGPKDGSATRDPKKVLVQTEACRAGGYGSVGGGATPLGGCTGLVMEQGSPGASSQTRRQGDAFDSVVPQKKHLAEMGFTFQRCNAFIPFGESGCSNSSIQSGRAQTVRRATRIVRRTRPRGHWTIDPWNVGVP